MRIEFWEEYKYIYIMLVKGLDNVIWLQFHSKNMYQDMVCFDQSDQKSQIY